MFHVNISRNNCGNAVVGRYGGCFEKDIIGLLGLCVREQIISRGLDVLAKYAQSSM